MPKPGRRRHDADDRRRARQLGDRVRQARERRRLSQQSLAGLAGMSISTLRKIESAETADPGFFTVSRLARALDLELSELVGDIA